MRAVVGEVAEEVDVLKRRPELSRTEFQRFNLGGTVDVVPVFVRVETANGGERFAWGVQIGSHRGKERLDEIRRDSGRPGRLRKRVDDEAVTDAEAQCAVSCGSEVVKQFALLARIESSISGEPINDLIGDSHKGIDVADVVPAGGPEEPGGKAERRRIVRDDGVGCLLSRPTEHLVRL